MLALAGWLSLSFAMTACSSKRPPTVILISIDGLRWDFPEKTATPTLDFLTRSGVRAERLIPSFPTKTFPNHYTIVTGLYPGHNGILANNMYDPVRHKFFALDLRDAIRDSTWWRGEPIWVTAEKQGLKTAPIFWVGSETTINGIKPTYQVPFDATWSNRKRVEKALELLDLPPSERPFFLTIYFNNVDDACHDFGTSSDEVKKAIRDADQDIGFLLAGLKTRNLLEKVDILVVSDHGHADLSPDRVIYLDDYLDLDLVQVVDWNPVAEINPAEETEEEIYDQLVHANPHWTVYHRDEIPRRYHYRGDRNLPKIIAVADEGWAITSHRTVKPEYISGSTHGFDNHLLSMGATFIAHGPDFKSGFKMPPFANIHIYELLTHLLDLAPAPNDGSLDSVKVMLRSDSWFRGS